MISQISQIFNNGTLNSLKVSLEAAGKRHEALADNVANISTPGYHRVDLDDQFKKSFAEALERLDKGEQMQNINLQAPVNSLSKSQGIARMDGNTVNLEQEMTEMIKNQADFDFSSRMMALQYSGLKAAISGNVT